MYPSCVQTPYLVLMNMYDYCVFPRISGVLQQYLLQCHESVPNYSVYFAVCGFSPAGRGYIAQFKVENVPGSICYIILGRPPYVASNDCCSGHIAVLLRDHVSAIRPPLCHSALSILRLAIVPQFHRTYPKDRSLTSNTRYHTYTLTISSQMGKGLNRS